MRTIDDQLGLFYSLIFLSLPSRPHLVRILALSCAKERINVSLSRVLFPFRSFLLPLPPPLSYPSFILSFSWLVRAIGRWRWTVIGHEWEKKKRFNISNIYIITYRHTPKYTIIKKISVGIHTYVSLHRGYRLKRDTACIRDVTV